MVTLDKVFVRFPQLSRKQRDEIARRRVIRAIDEIPVHVSQGSDLWYALGYLGTKNLFRRYA